MADDVTVINNSGNTGTDYVVATDEVQVSGTNPIGQVQFVKLVDGTLNGTTPIAGGANGLKVDGSSAAPPVGAALDATIVTTNTEIGGLTEAAPGTDTASSGLNGRLQRIAQRLTSLIALLPASLGQKTMANSLAVVVASDQSAVPISGTVTTTPPANASTNVTQFGSNNVVTGTGVGGAGIPRVTVSSDSTVGVTGSVTVTGTVDTELPTAAALGDADANPTAPMVGANLMGWSGASWARLKQAIGDGAGATGFLNIVPMMFNGSTYDRLRGSSALGLTVNGSGVTQPVSGTVSANLSGTDGITASLTAFMQALEGKNMLFTESPLERRLLESVLVELQTLNSGLGLSSALTTNPLPAKPDPIINGAVKSVASSTASQQLIGPSGNRSALSVYNNSTSILYLLASALGTVSSTFFTVILNPNDYWEAPQGPGGCYKGPLSGTWVSANGTANITEWSA